MFFTLSRLPNETTLTPCASRCAFVCKVVSAPYGVASAIRRAPKLTSASSTLPKAVMSGIPFITAFGSVLLALERNSVHHRLRQREAHEREQHAAEGGDERNSARAPEALDELALAFLPEGGAHGGVRQRDHSRLHHGEERHVLVEVRDLASVALILAAVRSGLAVRHHAREVHRDALGREADHLRLHGRVAGRHEEADAGHGGRIGTVPIQFPYLVFMGRCCQSALGRGASSQVSDVEQSPKCLASWRGPTSPP